MAKNLSTPNRMVWFYFEALRRLCYRTENSAYDNHKKQDAALCVILAVTGVEVFFNVYFRVLVSEQPYEYAKRRILDDLKRRRSLDRKLKSWPRIVLGKKLNLGSGVGRDFMKLKELRNGLMHFSSSHESIEVLGLAIHGLADTTDYESLDEHAAVKALDTAENLICEVFRLRGADDTDLCHGLHSWTGKLPDG